MLKLRVMTLNLGGGLKNFTGTNEPSSGKSEAINQLIKRINPDVLAVQEVSHYVDADGISHSMVNQIRQAGGFNYSYYGETLSMKKHMQVKKDLMVNGLFNDWWDWSKGNALFSREPFSRLGDERKEGSPRNVPIYQPLSYEGTRDTDPRYVILGRLKVPPFPYVLNLHLTTLIGERGKNAWSETINAAVQMRSEQLVRVLGLVEEHVMAHQLPLIMLGDFNAPETEETIKTLLEQDHGFQRLAPMNPIATHPSAGMVDHIFFFPKERLVDYHCEIMDGSLSQQVSDHLPVVADLTIE